MDGPSSNPNIPSSAEQPVRFTPENLQAGNAPRPEAAPSPAASPAGANVPAPQSKLTAADVAAAIAATPTVGTAPKVGAAVPTPGTAEDVDVIEPEWVDKAEEVVLAHHGDPYGEEEAIEVLQKDYLQKRYGIGVTNPNVRDTKPKGV